MKPNRFEAELKKVWEHMKTSDECMAGCSCQSRGSIGRCEGHAALLEMVDEVHVKKCRCCTETKFRMQGAPEDSGYPQKWCAWCGYFKAQGHKVDCDCKQKRRHLRAAVGTKEDYDDER